jgi:hypothetical protein
VPPPALPALPAKDTADRSERQKDEAPEAAPDPTAEGERPLKKKRSDFQTSEIIDPWSQ